MEPGGADTCTPLHVVWSDTSEQLRIPGLTLNFDWTLNLTMWFSYHVVSFWLHNCSTGLPWCTAIPLFTNHNVTACQSTRGHQVRTQNPCQQSLYNTYAVWHEARDKSHMTSSESSFILSSQKSSVVYITFQMPMQSSWSHFILAYHSCNPCDISVMFCLPLETGADFVMPCPSVWLSSIHTIYVAYQNQYPTLS